VNKSGAWYAYEGEKIGQGRENTKTYLEEHPDLMAEIEQKVRVRHGLDGAAEADAQTAEASETAEVDAAPDAEE